jgi:hypothetical protein
MYDNGCCLCLETQLGIWFYVEGISIICPKDSVQHLFFFVYHPIVHVYLNGQDFTYMFCGLWAISIICVVDIVEIVYFIFQIDCDTL